MTKFIAPQDKTYLTAEITFSKGDEIDLKDSEELINEVSKQVEEVGLIEKKKLYNASTNKENFVYPIYYKGYQQDLAKGRSAVSKFQPLYSIGTGGAHVVAAITLPTASAFDSPAG